MEIEAEIRKKTKYYRRHNNRWIYDDSVDEEAFIDTNTLFCNIREKCYKNKMNNVCESTDMSLLRMKKMAKDRVLREFDNRYGRSMDEIKAELNDKKDAFELLLQMTNLIIQQQLISLDVRSYLIGTRANLDVFIESPYIGLRDSIFHAQIDFAKRQQHIIQFVDFYCRDPLLTIEIPENKHWFYCKEKNTKLMPQSIYKLAVAYIAGKYSSVLDTICREVGEISDDGDSIVDKYTGYTLRKIEYREEGGEIAVGEDDSEKINQKMDMVQIVDIHLKKKKIYDDPKTQNLSNWISSILVNLNISSETVEDLALRLSVDLSLKNNIFFGKTKYDQINEDAKKKNAKFNPPDYETYCYTKYLEIVTCSIIVAVQTSIPDLSPKKSFPGCVQSFKGYPLEGSVDLSTIQYMACVLRKMYEKTVLPWNTIAKKENVMEERLKQMMDKHVFSREDVKKLYDYKVIYLSNVPDNEIPVDAQLEKKWVHFLPPIVYSTSKSPLSTVSSGFHDELILLLKKGNLAQRKMIGVYHSKIFLFTLAVHESIREIVREKDVLLMTKSRVPFMENACCNENTLEKTPMQYFMNADDKIKIHLRTINSLVEVVRDLNYQIRAPFIHDKRSKELEKESESRSESRLESKKEPTKTNILASYSETSLYAALILYCRIDHPIYPIPADLIGVCPEKPGDEYDSHSSIEEKIAFFKQKGKSRNLEQFIHLMRIVNRRNIVTLFTPIQPAYTEVVRNILEKLEQRANSRALKLLSGFKEVFMNKLQPETESDADKLKSLDDITNFVEPQNREMEKVIAAFMKKHGRVSKDELIKNMNLLDFEWKDSSISSIGTFIRNFIYDVTIVLPLYLSSNQLSAVTIEALLLGFNKGNTAKARWGFTFNDSTDLMRYIAKPYEFINSLKNDPIMTPFLKEVKERLSGIYELFAMFPLALPDTPDTRKLYIRVYTFFVYLIFITFIDLTEDSNVLRVTVENVRKVEREKYSEQDFLAEEIEEVDIQIGDKLSVQKKVHALLVTFFLKIAREKTPMEISYADIMVKMGRSMEREKKSIKDYFKKMDDEERKAEKIMKKLHLGKFQVSQKSLITYGKQQDLFGADDVGEDNDAQLINEYMNMIDAQAELDENPEVVDEDVGFEDDPEEDMFDIAENAYEDYDD